MKEKKYQKRQALHRHAQVKQGYRRNLAIPYKRLRTINNGCMIFTVPIFPSDIESILPTWDAFGRFQKNRCMIQLREPIETIEVNASMEMTAAAIQEKMQLK